MDRDMLILLGAGIALAMLYAPDAAATVNPAPDGETGETPPDGSQGFAVGESDYGIATSPYPNSDSPPSPSDALVDAPLQSPDPWIDWIPSIFTGKTTVTGSSPLGLRQNNPGNLRAWKAGQPTANGFRVFETMQAGLDELARQLLVYDKQGKHTIRAIVTTYAPSSENNTNAYIANVSGWMGLDPDSVMTLTDTNVLSNLMAAIIRQEQGQMPFKPGELQTAAYSRIQKGAALA